MAKSENENVYFPHYVNARNDRKIKRLRKELSVEGYGIFYMLLEVLREQSDLRYPIADIDLLAEDFGTSEQKVRVVICNYGLFVVDKEEFFFSPKQIEYLQPYFAKSNRAKHAALVRWGKVDANADANALPEHSKSIANAMQAKERKEEQSKVSVVTMLEKPKRFSPPTLSDTQDYFVEKGSTPFEAINFYEFYGSKGWKVGSSPMKDWKMAASRWIRKNNDGTHTSVSQQGSLYE